MFVRQKTYSTSIFFLHIKLCQICKGFKTPEPKVIIEMFDAEWTVS